VDGQAPRGLVAFTFDDGPNADTTPAVLEALDHYGVPGAFFVVTSRITGPRTARHRAALARVIEAGHVVAPHSVTHRNLRRASARTLRREIDGSLRAVIAAAGRPIGLFRPPFGALDRRGRAILAKRGLTDVRWSIDPADWQARDAAELRRRTVETVLRNEGGIVLLHDAKALTAQALPLILDDLEAANCQRLAEQRSPILPAPLHYFLHDRGEPRPVPAEIRRRTEAYRAALPARCAARAAAAPRADPAPAPPTPSATLAEAPAGAPAPAGARPAR
jgi:peptidoglycan/xylan/chitin deacetylase (PgdA/CDA1 family)